MAAAPTSPSSNLVEEEEVRASEHLRAMLMRSDM